MKANGSEVLKAPFPWFGGKSRVANIVWPRFGNVRNYVEPFFGSGAVLLMRPNPPQIETINDIDAFVCNFWRATKYKPLEVAKYADWPVNETDLSARHLHLVRFRKDLEKLVQEPEWFDPKVAGWWVWGISQWIGSEWCGEFYRKRPCMTPSVGVNRFMRSDGAVLDVSRRRSEMCLPRGVLGKRARGNGAMEDYFERIADRMKNVRVCCGDWERVCGPAVTTSLGLTGVFLDPPYSKTADRAVLYAKDDFDVAYKVREWAIAHGDDPQMRIALCGYQGEYTMPKSWACVPWKAVAGYAGASKNKDSKARVNAGKERIWFSPYCLRPLTLLGE